VTTSELQAVLVASAVWDPRRGQLQDRHRPKTQAIRHALDVSGADAIIALRCREASSTWEAICNTPRSQTRTA
jgi:hypothetical protein